MGRMEERLRKEVERTAQGAKKKNSLSLPDNPQSKNYVAPHRHCVVCSKPIHVDSDPAICSDSECISKNESRERSRKRLNVMLYLFPGIAIMLFVLPFFNQ